MDKLHSPARDIEIYEDESADQDMMQHEEEEDDTQIQHEFEEGDYNDSASDDDDVDDVIGGDQDEDPFSSSELTADNEDEITNGNGIVASIESPYSPSHSHDYSFSRTTPVHIDDRVDPHLGYVQDNNENLGSTSLYRDDGGAKLAEEAPDQADLRKVSESVSVLPDELEYYRSSLPGRSPLSISRAHQGSRAGSVVRDRGQVYAPSPRQHQHSLSTPAAVPLPSSPGHSRSNSAIKSDYRPVFRNPSSVRAMQLSSPSPPPFESSPLSGRRMRKAATPQADGFEAAFRQNMSSPQRPTPARRSAPKKEYPLVLLHCTLSMGATPASFPAAALEAVGASERTKRDVALLNQKLDNTVIERGLLIQHPGDDYELLEERILESLELRRPRVGGCGHFRSASVGSDGTPVKDAEHHVGEDDDELRCKDCARHVSPALLSQDEQDRVRRWDVRIYAANGLMRAGAWGAAWREMEKVDVEVGVWASDDMKCKLEEWAEDDGQGEMSARSSDAQTTLHHRRASDGTQMQHAAKPAPTATPASRATTSRAGDTSPEAASFDADAPAQREPEGPGVARKAPAPRPGQVPLSTLLYNHLERQFGKSAEMVLAAAVVVLGIYLALRSFQPESASPSPLAPAGPIASAVPRIPDAVDMEAVVANVRLAACTFHPSALDGQSAEMTALPRAAAARVLAAMGTAPPPPASSVRLATGAASTASASTQGGEGDGLASEGAGPLAQGDEDAEPDADAVETGSLERPAAQDDDEDGSAAPDGGAAAAAASQ